MSLCSGTNVKFQQVNFKHSKVILHLDTCMQFAHYVKCIYGNLSCILTCIIRWYSPLPTDYIKDLNHKKVFSSLPVYLHFACDLRHGSNDLSKSGTLSVPDLSLTLFTGCFTVVGVPAVPGLLMRQAFLMSTSVVLTQPGCKYRKRQNNHYRQVINCLVILWRNLKMVCSILTIYSTPFPDSMVYLIHQKGLLCQN